MRTSANDVVTARMVSEIQVYNNVPQATNLKMAANDEFFTP